MILDALLLAVGNLFHRRLRSWLTMIGIFIGIAAVVGLISLADGLKGAINEQFSSIGTDKLQIQGKGGGFGPPGANAVGKLTTSDVDLLRRIPGVKLVVGHIIRAVHLSFKTEQTIAYIESLPEESEARNLVFTADKFKMLEGDMIGASDTSAVVLGYTLAHDAFAKPVRVGQTIEINGRSYVVKGVMQKRGIFIYDQAILINEKPTRDIIGDKTAYDMLTVQSDAGIDLETLADRVTRAMRNDRHQKAGEEDFTVQTPAQAVKAVDTIINVVSIIVIGIALISLVVGGIGIMNTMYTAVLERTREIGIMKAIGARNSNIFTIFFIESGLLGLVGGGIGILLGIGLGKLVEFVAYTVLGPGLIHADITWGLALGALAFSFFVGAGSGVIPALQASRQKPVDSLRYE